MAYAPLSVVMDKRVLGCFVEVDYGKDFEYIENPEIALHPLAHGGKNVRFPHLIYVGPYGDNTRRAFVKGTVAYVVTDETDDGYTIEKWIIKKHRRYTK